VSLLQITPFSTAIYIIFLRLYPSLQATPPPPPQCQSHKLLLCFISMSETYGYSIVSLLQITLFSTAIYIIFLRLHPILQAALPQPPQLFEPSLGTLKAGSMVRQAVPGLLRLTPTHHPEPRELIVEGPDVHDGYSGRTPMSTLQEKNILREAPVFSSLTKPRSSDRKNCVLLPGSRETFLSVLR
jgi:hypothetical protein